MVASALTYDTNAVSGRTWDNGRGLPIPTLNSPYSVNPKNVSVAKAVNEGICKFLKQLRVKVRPRAQ